MYVGINWEAVTNHPARHTALLRALEQESLLSIFGPARLRGVAPWEGWRAYKGELPFDGVSVVHTAADCGIVLVLSSDEHKRSNVMSNRLFEALAAGAVIIADDHPFLQEHFETACFYLSEATGASAAERAVTLVKWINDNPDCALEKAKNGQKIFAEKFKLDTQLNKLLEFHANILEIKARIEIRHDLSIGLISNGNQVTISKTIDYLQRQTVKCRELLVSVPNDFSEETLAIDARVPVTIVKRHKSQQQNFGAQVTELAELAASDCVCFNFGFGEFFSTYVETFLRGFEDQGIDQVKTGYVTLQCQSQNGIKFHHPAFEQPSALTVPTFGFRRQAYLRHSDLFRLLDIEHWIAFANSEVFRRKLAICPQAIFTQDYCEKEVRLQQSKALKPEHLDTLVDDYMKLMGFGKTIVAPPSSALETKFRGLQYELEHRLAKVQSVQEEVNRLSSKVSKQTKMVTRLKRRINKISLAGALRNTLKRLWK